jgi:hypothetical protein
MPINEFDFAVLDDDERWADPIECAPLLKLGLQFLREVMRARFPRRPFLTRIDDFSASWAEMGNRYKRDRALGDTPEFRQAFEEIHLLGTIGHSIWRLRGCLETAGLLYELGELSRVTADNTGNDQLRLRSHGFCLLSAAFISHQGFQVEFIERRDGQATPDFFALRDTCRFPCEATTRLPEQGDFDNAELFWTEVIAAVERKARQFRAPEFENGVLILDCTPVWDAFRIDQLNLAGIVMCYVPPEMGGPRQQSAPLIRIDRSPAVEKLRTLADALTGTNIRTLILWKKKLVCGDVEFRRFLECRIIATMAAASFWSYFDRAIVLPGPGVNVNWE